MSNNKVTFSISSMMDNDIIDLTTPLQVSYLIDKQFTIDNTNGETYPNFAIAHKNIYNTVDKIYNLFNEDKETPAYVKFDWNEWYPAGSLVYTYNEDTKYYAFYKAKKMTNPFIDYSNEEFWNSYETGILSHDEYDSYTKGTKVYKLNNGVYRLYECIKDTNGNIPSDNEEYWKPLNLEAWSYDKKYNIGSKVFLVDESEESVTIYISIKTVLPVTRIDNREYWEPFFDYYALKKIANDFDDINLINAIEEVSVKVEELKSKFEINTIGMTKEEFEQHFLDMYSINENIKTLWDSVKNIYNDDQNKEYNDQNKYLWKNLRDADFYFTNLYVYNNNPVIVLESLKYLDSFKELVNSEEKKSIVAYVKDLQDPQEPGQKNGAYFIYNIKNNRFIKALLGTHDHPNKEILDAIALSYDEVSPEDNNSDLVLTIRKERAEGTDELGFTYHAQFKNIDTIPNRPTDGKAKVLVSDEEGNINWSDKFANSLAFVKRVGYPLEDSNEFEFEDIHLSTDDEGLLFDSVLLFKDSIFIPEIDLDYDHSTKILRVSEINPPQDRTSFSEGEVLTLIIIRNTSKEMLSRLSDQYISKAEAIEILSNGNIQLKDYVRKEELGKYSLRNHIHTNYSTKDHNHDGIYADYYHNHDDFYMTRDEVNKIIANTLRINPELVDTISMLADGLTEITNYINQEEFNLYKNETDNRLSELESMNLISGSPLYINSDGLVLKRELVEGQFTLVPADIKANQIMTKYPKSEETNSEFMNLEEWQEYILETFFPSEKERIQEEINYTLREKKYIRNKILSNKDISEPYKVTLKDFYITGISIRIVEPFLKSEIRLLRNDKPEPFIDSEYIIEDTKGVMEYSINEEIVNETIFELDIQLKDDEVNNDDDETGVAVVNIIGYTI